MQQARGSGETQARESCTPSATRAQADARFSDLCKRTCFEEERGIPRRFRRFLTSPQSDVSSFFLRRFRVRLLAARALFCAPFSTFIALPSALVSAGAYTSACKIGGALPPLGRHPADCNVGGAGGGSRNGSRRAPGSPNAERWETDRAARKCQQKNRRENERTKREKQKRGQDKKRKGKQRKKRKGREGRRADVKKTPRGAGGRTKLRKRRFSRTLRSIEVAGLEPAAGRGAARENERGNRRWKERVDVSPTNRSGGLSLANLSCLFFRSPSDLSPPDVVNPRRASATLGERRRLGGGVTPCAPCHRRR